MKLLAVSLFLAVSVPLSAQIVININRTSFATAGSADFFPSTIGTVSSSPAGAQLTLTLSAPWIDFYTGPADGSDCTDNNHHAHSIPVVTPAQVTICTVMPAPLQSGSAISFITASPAEGGGLSPVTVPIVLYVIPTGTVHIDQVQVDVSDGSASVTITEDSQFQSLHGSPLIDYESGSGWLQENDQCAGVHATADGPGLCKVTLTANPNAMGLSAGGQYWASITVTDGGSAAGFSIQYTHNSPLRITSPALFRLPVDQPFTTVLTAEGGTGGYQWSATGLRRDLQITPGGTVFGTPDQILSGPSDGPNRPQAQIIVQDSAGNFASQAVMFALLGPTRDKVGIFRGGLWVFDATGNGQFDGIPPDSEGAFGVLGDIPILGDWTGTGSLRIGVFRQGTWFLDLNGNGLWDGPNVDLMGNFGAPGDIPVVGDWDGTGKTRVGVFRQGMWFLDLSGTAEWTSNNYLTDNFGLPGDIPVVGDWDGGGTKVGVFRQGTWFLDRNGNGVWDGPNVDLAGNFGLPGDIPVVGKWPQKCNDGTNACLDVTKVGVFRNGEWHLNLSATPQWSATSDRFGYFGQPGDIPLVGDWDGSGETNVGVFRNGEWHLDLSGVAQWSPSTDLVGPFGAPTDLPISGNWPSQ